MFLNFCSAIWAWAWEHIAAISKAGTPREQEGLRCIFRDYHFESQTSAACAVDWKLCMKTLFRFVTVLSLSCCVRAQTAEAPAFENWNLYYQATSIGQTHVTFNAPYIGPFSLEDYRENDVSLTSTLFFDVRLARNLTFVFDPEIAGGRGFSGVNGLANQSNGELPRVATATPKPYIARLYISCDFGFGSEKEHVESDVNQLAGDRPMVRYT